jgi:NADPH:quinone reductase
LKAATFSAFGDVDQIRLSDVAVPVPGPRDVLIQVAYAGVNPSDWKEVSGALADGQGQSLIVPGRRYHFPMITGCDASGVITAIGAEVNGFQVGDRVVTLSDGPAKWGTFAEHAAVRADHVAKMPASLDFAAAAAYPVAATTAWQALFAKDKGALQRGDSALIHGAAGGVGTFALQFCRIRVVSTAAACRAANAEYVRTLGAEIAIDYERGDIPSSVRAWRPRGVDVLLDAVGGESIADPCSLIRSGGRLVNIATITHDGDVQRQRAEAAARGVERIPAVGTSRGCQDQLNRFAHWFDSGELTRPR